MKVHVLLLDCGKDQLSRSFETKVADRSSVVDATRKLCWLKTRLKEECEICKGSCRLLQIDVSSDVQDGVVLKYSLGRDT